MRLAAWSSILSCVLLAAPKVAAEMVGNQAFLGRDGLPHVLASTDLLHELEVVAGRDHRLATERRVARLETALRPMFLAMPKDTSGKLHSMSVRYVLHRLFVQRHGWFVNGLKTTAEESANTSLAQIFEKHVGEDVHSVFERRLSTEGFSLNQVAIFAATLEALVHRENIERLEAAYKFLGLSKQGNDTDQDCIKAEEIYMLMYVLNMNHSIATSRAISDASVNIMDIYPTWPDTKEFVRGVRESVLVDVVGADRTSWNTTLKVLEQVGERYGRWQDNECRRMKEQLVTMDKDGNGRVPLDQFYEEALTTSTWQFMESVPYLRQLGALDETDPRRLGVIISNYINSPSNCLASSKFYAVCCIDECHSLLGSLETHIGAPEADPALISQLVSGLKSPTVTAPRQLEETLLQRLAEIATYHGGSVPLHGRLFAQWMHHAYPRECPYPHKSGTTNPVAAEEYYAMTGNEVEATNSEILGVLSKSSAEPASTATEALPWTAEEELFVHRHKPLDSSSSAAMLMRNLAFAGAVALAGVGLMGKYKPGDKSMIVADKSSHKYYV